MAQVAIREVYPPGAAASTSRGPVNLSTDYLKQARTRARHCVALAGYRLKDLLLKLDESPAAVPVNPPAEQPEKQSPATAFGRAVEWLSANRQAWWLVSVTGLASAYLVSVGALLLLVWQGKAMLGGRTRLLSPSWLIGRATQLLLVAPGLGRAALFLGYRRRLAKNEVIANAGKNYFGVPATLGGESVLYDPSGSALHERVARELGPQRPVLVVGKGGAGKTTLLARWASLALEGRLPAPLQGFRPIFVPASYYRDDLLAAVATVLKERDGVNVTREIVSAQLQSGNFLVLFDGITEIESDDKARVLRDVLRVARSAEYQTCRFLLTTRPVEDCPAEVPAFQLQPLTADVLHALVPRTGLNVPAENRLRRQLQAFGAQPLEPMLFAMAVAESESEQVSPSRSSLYERYFQRLLRMRPNEVLAWRGWREALETVAGWSVLETGKRGVGLRHQDLVNRVSRPTDKDGLAENLVKRLNRLYPLNLKSELELLDRLSAAGLLHFERRWRFSHDTFEEYFAACRLVSIVDQTSRWPDLPEWKGKEAEFLEVMRFLAELCDPNMLADILGTELPPLWKDALRQGAVNA
jgi:hypothetical protein